MQNQKDVSIISYDEYEPVFQAPEFVQEEQRSFSQGDQENRNNFSQSNSQSIQSKSKMIAVDSCYQNSVAERKSLQYTSIEPNSISHKARTRKSINTISYNSAAFATRNENSKSNKTIEGMAHPELIQQNQEVVRSCDRMGESLKNHINAFKDKVFDNGDIIFPQDRNLISNQHVKNSQGGSQYFDSLQSKHRRGTECISIRQSERNIKSSAQSKIDIREKNQNSSSKGARSKISLQRESYNDYNNPKR